MKSLLNEIPPGLRKTQCPEIPDSRQPSFCVLLIQIEEGLRARSSRESSFLTAFPTRCFAR